MFASRKFIQFALACSLFSLLAACGQKGALHRDQKDSVDIEQVSLIKQTSAITQPATQSDVL